MRHKLLGAILLSSSALFSESAHSTKALIESPVSQPSGILALASLDDSETNPSPPLCESTPTCEYTERVQIGGSYTYCWITPEGNPTTRGSLGGVQAIYEHRPTQAPYLGAAFSYRTGTTTNNVGKRKLQDFNPQARVGYTFARGNLVSRFTAFTGLGARYMAETVTIRPVSVDFDYTEFYVPVGFLSEKSISSCFSIGCNFQWMPQIFPLVRIQPLGGARWDLTYQLLNFFVEVPFALSMCGDHFALSINPFVETWRDGRSTAVTNTGLSLNLPGNKYLFAGVNVNLAFSY